MVDLTEIVCRSPRGDPYPGADGGEAGIPTAAVDREVRKSDDEAQREQLADALGALSRPLSAADVAALEALAPAEAVAGTRYTSEQMKHLDSEK